MEYYYSAPPSPRKNEENGQKNGFASSIFDDFEFETSKKFECSPIVDDTRHHERSDSLPAMAFADELFVNGLVMPLKPPPRLQYDSDHSFSQKSPVSSPKFPRAVHKLPFARRNAWNDDFDPFIVALEKVREEKRNSFHRRSVSQRSPFRTISKANAELDNCNQENSPGNSPRVLHSSFSGPLDFKGSAYARWARSQIQEGALSPPKSPRGFLFGNRVNPVKTEEDYVAVDDLVGVKDVGEKCEKAKECSKVQKLKGAVLKYASFRRQNSVAKEVKTSPEVQKPSYFSRLSFRFKGNGNECVKKNKPKLEDEKIAIVRYRGKQSFGSCMGYGVSSPGGNFKCSG